MTVFKSKVVISTDLSFPLNISATGSILVGTSVQKLI